MTGAASSGPIAGWPRRRYKNAADLASYGVTVVDLSNVKGTDSSITPKFADNPELVKMTASGCARMTVLPATEVTDRVNLLDNRGSY